MRDWLVIAIGAVFLFAILPNVYAQENIPSPLKQVQSGVLPQDIKCKEGFVLIIRANGDPTCVKPTSITRLLSHGWITLEKFELIHQITNNTSNNTTSLVNTAKTVTNSISTNNNYAVRVFNIEDNSTLPITPTITPIKPGIIKPISIGILSYPIKVGGYPPEFTFTFQGISDDPYYVSGGCVGTSLFDTILPSDYVKEEPAPAKKCADWQKKIEPNETITTVAHSKSLNGYYEILKPGILHVSIDLYATDQKTGWTLIETIQFDVNAIDNSTNTNQVSTNNTNFANMTKTISSLANSSNNNNTINATESNSTHTLSQGIIFHVVNPIVTSTMPGYVKILSVDMMPNPLRVGDIPRFSVTYQNISDKKITHMDAPCPVFTYTISPSDSVSQPQQVGIHGCGSMGRAVFFSFIQPNQIITDVVSPSLPSSVVVKNGTITVTMKLPISIYTSFDDIETVQFNVDVVERDPSAESFISSLDLNSGNYLNEIGGIATDSIGNLYVVEINNDRVEKLDPSGKFLMQFGSYGNGNGQFNYPEGIAVDRSDNIYVMDFNNNRVEKFSSSGSYLSQINGSGSGIAVDNAENIYLVGGDAITKFDHNGNLLFQIGQVGRGIAVDKSGNFYVGVGGESSSRIEKFNSSGDYLSQIGIENYSLGIPKIPNDLAVDRSGDIYVVDIGTGSIEKFSSVGNYLYQLNLAPYDNQQGALGHIALDSSGNIYITAFPETRIDKFSPK